MTALRRLVVGVKGERAVTCRSSLSFSRIKRLGKSRTDCVVGLRLGGVVIPLFLSPRLEMTRTGLSVIILLLIP
jgi:hypothetical protein